MPTRSDTIPGIGKAAISATLMLGPLIVVPIVAARYIVAGTWSQIVAAYALWLIPLGLMLGGKRGLGHDGRGCMLAIAWILTMLVVPTLTALIRAAGFFAAG